MTSSIWVSIKLMSPELYFQNKDITKERLKCHYIQVLKNELQKKKLFFKKANES